MFNVDISFLEGAKLKSNIHSVGFNIKVPPLTLCDDVIADKPHSFCSTSPLTSCRLLIRWSILVLKVAVP